MIRRPPRSTLFPTRRSSDLHRGRAVDDDERLAPRLALLDDRRARRDPGFVGRPGDLLELTGGERSEEHTSELQSRQYLVCRLLLEKKRTPLCSMTSYSRRKP